MNITIMYELLRLLLNEVMCFRFFVGSYRVISGIKPHENYNARQGG